MKKYTFRIYWWFITCDLCVYFLFEIRALSKFAIHTFSTVHLKLRKKDKRKINLIEQSFYLNKKPMIIIEGKLTSSISYRSIILKIRIMYIFFLISFFSLAFLTKNIVFTSILPEWCTLQYFPYFCITLLYLCIKFRVPASEIFLINI